jgi:2-methylcitrate dehydratase PrpD
MLQTGCEMLAERLSTVRYEKLSTEVRRLAKSCVLDWIGAAIAGSRSEAGRIIAQLVRDTDSTEDCVLIGNPARASRLAAALSNGTIGHALEIDDYYVVGFPLGHLGTITIPVGLALADKQPCNGQQLIEAVVAGYEAAVRVNDALGPEHYGAGWHATGTTGTFGAAATAASILGLDPGQTVNALGLAGTQSAGMIESFSSYGKPLHAGRSCEGGLLSAMLAQRGYKGSSTILEGRSGMAVLMSKSIDLEQLTKDFGKEYAIQRNSFKIYFTACFDVADITLELVKKHNLAAADVEKITYGTISDFAKNQVGMDPQTITAAKTSTQYVAAVAVLERAVSLAQFTQQKLRDPRIREMMAKIEIASDPEVEALVAKGHYSLRITLKTRDGHTLTEFMRDTRGHFLNPVTHEDLETKFRTVTAGILPADRTEPLLDMIRRLDQIPDVTQLTAQLQFAD